MMTRPSLRTRILYWLGGYALLLTAAVFLHGVLVNEYAERLVWKSLLRSELDHVLERSAEDPAFRWNDTDNLKLYGPGEESAIPAELAALPPGLVDEIVVQGREQVVLVRQVGDRRYVLSLDITEMEQEERRLSAFILASTLLLVIAMGAVMIWGLGRALRPLSAMAEDIVRLKPDRGQQRVAVDEKAGSELTVIAGALNDYLARHDRFVERERIFIDSASHELRTPIAVIAGAAELALEQPDLPVSARGQIQRIHRTARDVEQLISLLLVLARDPARLSRNADDVALDELLPEIIEDHRYLTKGKRLTLVADALPPCVISAPLAIIQAAIGNLLRNAIENSDQGEIRISLSADATVTITDPGHGMTPDEISRIYAQIARGGGRGREGGGIGMELLGRLCEHLGWQLHIRSVPGSGTISTLKFSA